MKVQRREESLEVLRKRQQNIDGVGELEWGRDVIGVAIAERRCPAQRDTRRSHDWPQIEARYNDVPSETRLLRLQYQTLQARSVSWLRPRRSFSPIFHSHNSAGLRFGRARCNKIGTINLAWSKPISTAKFASICCILVKLKKCHLSLQGAYGAYQLNFRSGVWHDVTFS